MQVDGSAYEWSDGTRFDYKDNLSDSKERFISNKQEAVCVVVTPAGAWVKTSCNAMVDGAICYTTPVTTSSQSKTPI